MDQEAFLREATAEFQKLKQQADRAADQVTCEELFQTIDPESNSLAMLMKHLAGNMRSRWTDFLTSDGEKPDRNRDSEFIVEPGETAESIQARWETGWKLLLEGMSKLRPEDLERSVMIRGERLAVPEAILRQLTHHAAHVGQMVFLAKHWAGSRWNTLSIPRGKSEEFKAQMLERLRRSKSGG